MKKKTIANLIAIVVIVSVAAFSGCIEEKTLEPIPAPVVAPTLTPTTTPTPTITATPSTTSTPTEWAYLIMATASQKANQITVTYTGGPAANVVNAVTVTFGANKVNLADVVGNSTTFTGTPGAGNDHIVVNASFTDGTNLIILDTWV